VQQKSDVTDLVKGLAVVMQAILTRDQLLFLAKVFRLVYPASSATRDYVVCGFGFHPSG
jgi:hypothetical protein